MADDSNFSNMIEISIISYLHRVAQKLLNIHYMFTISSLYVHCIIHYIFTIYSLYIHYIFTISALYIHYMLTICLLTVCVYIFLKTRKINSLRKIFLSFCRNILVSRHCSYFGTIFLN